MQNYGKVGPMSCGKIEQIKQMWHLQMICSKFAIEVNPFFRPVIILWNNKNITIAEKSIYWKDWHAAGIERICDLLNEIVNF